ncbi:MAG: Gfo/Idh/MocA family oxidoreductase [Candidatus Latescibacteria bacterium]|jgi:predicted dehydrogenase|nr:Gfo/Idh/MocA family oxidoreductase [Candidatus Latescibacterota bacterium]
MEKVRFGVVGLGQMGTRFSRIISESPRADLTAVADIDPARVEETIGQWGGSGHGDVETLLSDAGEVDALVIATPDQLHVEPSVAGARAGKHLFVEKPLAFTEGDCRTIIAEVEDAGVKLLVGQTLRWDPRFSSARDAIREGRIGELVHTFSRRNNPHTVVHNYKGRVSIAYFLGIHDIDFLLWSIDSKVKQVYAAGRRGFLTAQGYDLYDTVFSILTFESGVVSCLENSWWVPDNAPGRMYAHMFEAEGTSGDIHLIPEQTGLMVRGVGFCDYPNAVYAPETQGRFGGVYRDEIEHFIDCIVADAPLVATGAEATRAVAAVEAVHRSLEIGAPVEVEI